MTTEEIERYVDKMFHQHDRLMLSKFESIDNAIGLAREDVARRLAELNQLRSEVTSDRNQFVQQAIYEAREKDAGTWREAVSDRLTKIETRALTWSTAVGLFFTLVNIAILLLKK